ncbi:MAG: protein BatD [Chromatiales bacterium]|nr:protein BatD [Chromatiales bacterium]
MVKRLLFGLLLWLSANLAAAALTAEVDRRELAFGDTLTLVVDLRDGQVGGEPDLRALEQDFEILGSATQQYMQSINGRTQRGLRWQYTLAPRRAGQLTIPALALGSQQTAPIVLTVRDAPADQRSDEVWVETVVDRTNPHVGEQVIVAVRIFTLRRISGGELSDPPVSGATLESLGEDLHYQTRRGEQNYAVIERRFALFPRTPGRIEIGPAVFDGSVVAPAQRPSSGWGIPGFFDQTRRLRRRSEPVALEVRPAPVGAGWLPAEELALEERWEPAAGEPIAVGRPVTRTVTLRATGLSPLLIPDLTADAPDGVRAFAEPVQTEQRATRDGIAVEARRSIAYIANAAGQYRLPPIALRWWDAGDKAWREANLPARTITVEPAAIASGAAPPAPVAVAERPTAEAASARSDAPLDRVRAWLDDLRLWRVLAAVGFALWLLALWGWWRARRSRAATGRARPVAATTGRVSLERIARAARDNDPGAAQTAWLDWAAARWPQDPPRNLRALAARLDDTRAAAALIALDGLRYGPAGDRWDGAAHWRAVRSVAPADRPASKRSEWLPRLYPNG